jgi:hypothetical protein
MRLTIISILLCHSIVHGQNLVPNPSFEATNDTISKFTVDHLEFKSKIKNGISKDRIDWIRFGEDHPIANNENEEGRSKNRRVKFEVIK